MRKLYGGIMTGGSGSVFKARPKDREAEKILVGDVELTEVQGQRGRFTGYKEEGAKTVVVDMTIARRGYGLKVYFLGGGEWVQNLRGDKLSEALKEWGFKGDELGKVLHEGDLRGAGLDKALGGAGMVRVVEGKGGGADFQIIKEGKVVQTLEGAIVNNYVNISEGWTGIPHGSAGETEEFIKFWDAARMAMVDYLKRKGRDLPERITPFLGQGHIL